MKKRIFGEPKKDGSGKGFRSNKGRKGCKFTEKEGKGKEDKLMEKTAKIATTGLILAGGAALIGGA